MRRTLDRELSIKMQKDKSIVFIIGGVGDFKNIKTFFPDRYFDLGIREQSIISIASGMALNGLKPYVYGITPFIIERAFEQIKIDINAMKTNVTLLCYDEYPKDGLTHKAINIKKEMSLFKNIKSFYPKNKNELMNAINQRGPKFIRLINI